MQVTYPQKTFFLRFLSSDLLQNHLSCFSLLTKNLTGIS